MIKKLKLCSIVFDFSPASDPGKDNLGKEMKRQVLLELVDHISQLSVLAAAMKS